MVTASSEGADAEFSCRKLLIKEARTALTYRDGGKDAAQ
jgi:hypothetical protein